jgi:hypothetical protein
VADTIWDQIMDYVEASLGRILVSNQFNHDVGSDGVGFWRAVWEKNWPEINLVDAAETKEDHNRTDAIVAVRAVEIEMVDRLQPQASGRAVSKKFESMKSDIFKAVFRDHTQGSNAIDTDYIGCAPVVYEDDLSLIGCAVVFQVKYRFIYDDLTRKS